MQIEPPGVLVKRILQQCAHTDDLSRLCRADECVLEQGLTESLTLFGMVERKPGEKDHPYGMIGQTLGNPLRGVASPNTGSNQRIVAGNPVAATGDIGLGGIGLLVLPGIPYQPIVERRLATIEAGKVVVA